MKLKSNHNYEVEMYRLSKVIALIISVFGITLLPIYADDNGKISLSGLDGEVLTAIASSPRQDFLVVGTEQGLYIRMTKEAEWRRMVDFPNEKIAVRQILVDADRGIGFAATQKGLFRFGLKEMKAENIFFRSSTSEMDTIAIVTDSSGGIYLGTKAGLFCQKATNSSWVKLATPFVDQSVLSLFVSDDVVYAATPEGVFESKDNGTSWDKIFNIYSQSSPEQTGVVDNEISENEGIAPAVKQVVGSLKNKMEISVLTTRGVFWTNDDKKWTPLPMTGIDYANTRYMAIHQETGQPIVLTKTGLYEYINDQWKTIAEVFDGQMLALDRQGLFVVAKHDIFVLAMDGVKKVSYDKVKKAAQRSLEPSVQDVQQMAISYAELSDRKIKDWRRRASLKAFIPQVSVSIDKNVYGSSTGAFAVGPRDWGVGLCWDLADFIYTDAITSIDSRAKLMVELRNDILAEATRLYFERKKILMDLDTRANLSEKERMDKELRLEEVAALIDRLTGGTFSKALKS